MNRLRGTFPSHGIPSVPMRRVASAVDRKGAWHCRCREAQYGAERSDRKSRLRSCPEEPTGDAAWDFVASGQEQPSREKPENAPNAPLSSQEVAELMKMGSWRVGRLAIPQIELLVSQVRHQ